MVLDTRYAYMTKLRSHLLYLTTPIQYLVDWPIKTYQWLTQSVTSHRALLNENIELRYQQVLLKGKLQRLLSLQKENVQLRKLLAYKASDSESHFLLAELLSVKTDPYRRMIILNRGKKDNVFTGQAVFDATGVMGQVVEVGPLTSTVMLITDPQSSVPVKNARTGERAILNGTNHLNRLSLSYLPNTSSVKIGDELLTSGLGKRFPEGYPVGVVSYVKQDPNEAFMQVEVIPSAKLAKSRLMLLTWHSDNEQQLLAELLARHDLAKGTKT